MKTSIVLGLLLMPFLLMSQGGNLSNSISQDEEIYKVVDIQPLFPGCEEIENYEERKQCAGAKMVKFIEDNLHYPNDAKEDKIEGTVYLMFVVEKDGSISNIDLVRDIGGGCGEESLRIVKMMPVWNPGKQRGKVVRTRYNLPVRFDLKPKKRKND